jgi:hypothetical protein
MRVWEVIAIREGNHSEFVGGVMSSHRHNNNSGEVRVESEEKYGKEAVGSQRRSEKTSRGS